VRSLRDVMRGRVGGFSIIEIARRTVPCYKYVQEHGKEPLAVCLLVDSGRLYRYPFEDLHGIRALKVKAQYLRGEMEGNRLREYMPGHCRYVNALPPAAALDGSLLRQSSALLALYVEDRLWLKRRTDVAEVMDEAAIRWTRTLELTIPDVNVLAGTDLQLDDLPMPLALHSKEVLTGFRMVDGQGRRLSMLARHEDQPLIQGMLRLMAQDVYGDVLPDFAVQLLNAIVTGTTEQAEEHLADLLEALPSLLEDADNDDALLRRKRGVLRVLIADLADWFILMTWLPNTPDEAHVIEYTFTDSGRFGGQRREAELELDIGAARSFHFELVAPEELDLKLRQGQLQPAPTGGIAVQPTVVCEGRYLTLWAGDAPRGQAYNLRFEMRLHRPGLALIALVVSLLATSALMLAITLRFFGDVHPAPDVAAPVLVALPAALTALLVREVRHRLTATLAFEARLSIGLTALALAVASVSIALKFPDPPAVLAIHGLGWRALIWSAAAAVSVLITTVTLVRQGKW